jgi:regulatory protein
VKTVTALRARGRESVEVELDGAPWRALPADAVVRAGLSVGTVLDRPLARRLGRELRRSRATVRAARAIERRDRSTQELDLRLAVAGVDRVTRADVLETFARAGLVDDARFARGRASALAERGWGDAAVRADLERRGIPAEATEEAVSALDPEPERAARIVARRGPGPRTARYLAARGFDADLVESLVAHRA